MAGQFLDLTGLAKFKENLVNLVNKGLSTKQDKGSYVTTSSLAQSVTTELVKEESEQLGDIYFKKRFPSLSQGTPYANLDQKYKDGSWHRLWRIRFPTGSDFWGKVRITIYGNYSSFNASGVMDKTVTCNFNADKIYNNCGFYDSLGLNIERDFRITEAIWNSSVKCWEFLIWQEHLNGNNNIPGVIIEAWANGERNLKSAKGITITPVELTQMKEYIAPKASISLGDKKVNLFDLPVYETPYGLEVATVDGVNTTLKDYVTKVDMSNAGWLEGVKYGDPRPRPIEAPSYGLNNIDISKELDTINVGNNRLRDPSKPNYGIT